MIKTRKTTQLRIYVSSSLPEREARVRSDENLRSDLRIEADALRRGDLRLDERMQRHKQNTPTTGSISPLSPSPSTTVVRVESLLGILPWRISPRGIEVYETVSSRQANYGFLLA